MWSPQKWSLVYEKDEKKTDFIDHVKLLSLFCKAFYSVILFLYRSRYKLASSKKNSVTKNKFRI